MTSIRTATLKKHNSFVHRAQVSHLTDEISKKLMSLSKVTLEFIVINTDSGSVSLPNATEAKTSVQESLAPPPELYGQNFFNMPMMP